MDFLNNNYFLIRKAKFLFVLKLILALAKISFLRLPTNKNRQFSVWNVKITSVSLNGEFLAFGL